MSLSRTILLSAKGMGGGRKPIAVFFGGTGSSFIGSAAACIGASQSPEQLNMELGGVVPMFTSPTPLPSPGEVPSIKEASGVFTVISGLLPHKLTAIRLFDYEDGYDLGVVGTSYAESAPLPNKRAKVDFSKFEMRECRIVITAQGDEVGAGKGIEIYDQTGTTQLCEVTWNGNALQQALAGSWTSAHIPSVDSELRIRVKASSITESITVYAVDLEVKASEQDIPV